jgi:hypothetical protein
MINKPIVTCVCQHSFEPTPYIHNLNLQDCITNIINHQHIPRYKHKQECYFKCEDKQLLLISPNFITRSKQHAFIIYKILKDFKFALLYKNNHDSVISYLAKFKLDHLYGYQVKIKHIYLNKIPKEHFVKKESI